MITLITNNPYRILGVYSNSPKKDVLSNLNKLKAFLKVGKSVSFPLDLPEYLPAPKRDEATVAQAQSAIERPLDQLKHSLPWFMKATPIDDIAFNHLLRGNIQQAKEIWHKQESVSSLLNLTACAAMEHDYTAMASCADRLFQNHAAELCSSIHETLKLSPSQLTELLANMLKEDGETDLSALAKVRGASADWKKVFAQNVTEPMIAEINSAIAEAIGVKGSAANYAAGMKLMNSTKGALVQLKELLTPSNTQYQMIADKLAETILQCGILYFNDSRDDDAPQKAMQLQGYALSIAVGLRAKNRCKENVDILEDTIANLPPQQVASEVKFINSELEKYCKLPDSISHAITLLTKCKPYVQKIKTALGASNAFYLKISTLIVGNALHNIIEEVNEAQNYDPTPSLSGNDSLLSFWEQDQYRDLYLDTYSDILSKSSQQIARQKYEHVKSALTQAWKAIKLMDGYDMEASFKAKRYKPNRDTLQKMCNQVDIDTKSKREKYEPWLFASIPFIIIEIIAVIIAFNSAKSTGDIWFISLLPILPFPPICMITYYICGKIGKFLWKRSGRDEKLYNII